MAIDYLQATYAPRMESGMVDRGLVIGREAYHLSPEGLGEIESRAADYVKNTLGINSGVVALTSVGDTNLSNFSRTIETNTFEGYDFHGSMMPYESRSIFVNTIDVDSGKIAHVKRIVEANSLEQVEATGLTGIEIIDDRLNTEIPEEAVALSSIIKYHNINNISKSLNITTNMGTGRIAPSKSRPYSLASYKAIFEIAQDKEKSHLFAYLNPLAIKSLGRIGLQYDLLAGGEYHLPHSGSKTEYDIDYKAVCIPNTEHNIKVFTEAAKDRPITRLVADMNIPVFHVEGNV